MTQFDYQYMLLDTVPRSLFWTLAGISCACVLALVVILIYLLINRKQLKSDLEVNESLLSLSSKSTELYKSKLKHAQFRCNRCGRFVIDPHWDGTDPVCAICWQKHVSVKSIHSFQRG